MTERQYQVWLEWLKKEWNTPNRSDHYQMQSAMEACRGRLKNPGQVKLDHFKLQFRFKEPRPIAPYNQQLRQRGAVSKAFWLGMMTMPVEGLPDELRGNSH